MNTDCARRRTVVSWSSGKDSAWMLGKLQRREDIELAGLLTTFNKSADRVAMHAVRRSLVSQQARAAGLTLFDVELPWPCSNEQYEKALRAEVGRLVDESDVHVVAFGDLFLEDIRRYRETQMRGWRVGLEFPLWQHDTAELARDMVAGGVRAILTCVDPKQCPAEFAGAEFDDELLDALPATVDPCGENGEFHTFVFDCPAFSRPLDIVVGETVERDGFVFADVLGR